MLIPQVTYRIGLIYLFNRNRALVHINSLYYFLLILYMDVIIYKLSMHMETKCLYIMYFE
jgi:hypothetical protein